MKDVKIVHSASLVSIGTSENKSLNATFHTDTAVAALPGAICKRARVRAALTFKCLSKPAYTVGFFGALIPKLTKMATIC